MEVNPPVPRLGQNGGSAAVGVDPGPAHPMGRPVAAAPTDVGLVVVAVIARPPTPVAASSVAGDAGGDDGVHGVPLAGSVDLAKKSCVGGEGGRTYCTSLRPHNV